jgi:hypothetical protein
MGLFSKLSTSLALKRLEEEKLFLQVHDELENGTINKGLWMKALANSGGDESLAKIKYIKFRIQSFKDEIAISDELEETFNKLKSYNAADSLTDEDKKPSLIREDEEKIFISRLEKLGYRVNIKWTCYEVIAPNGEKVKLLGIADLERYLGYIE